MFLIAAIQLTIKIGLLKFQRMTCLVRIASTKLPRTLLPPLTSTQSTEIDPHQSIAALKVKEVHPKQNKDYHLFLQTICLFLQLHWERLREGKVFVIILI